jgi:hypothetical protein
VPDTKNHQTKKAQQEKRIEDLWRFTFTIIPHFAIGFITVIQWQERLNNAGHPEEGHKSGNKKEHFP